MTVAAIVLAGGASTRFGSDKLAATLGGRPLLSHAVESARAVATRVIVVVGPEDPAPPIEGVEVVRDAVAHAGPLAGLVTGLEAARAGARVLVLAGDMPTVRPDVARLLLTALDDAAIAAARLEVDPPHPLPLAVRAAVALPAARALLAANRRALLALVDSIPTTVVPASAWRALDPAGTSLHDVDTPSDLDAS